VPDRITGVVQQHQRRQTAFQCEIHVRAKIAKTVEQAAHPAWPARGHECAGAFSYAGSREQ